MKIVIAEDDDITRQSLRKSLEDLNFEVSAFADGSRAWDHLQAHPAQVVIASWTMPGLDGLDLCRRLRVRTGLGPYVYLILLTERKSREDLLKALQAGADEMMSRPLDRAELFARLNVARRIVDMESQLRSRSAELERLHAELERRNALLSDLASSDGLTGLKNHRFFRGSLEAQFSLARWRGVPLSVVMLDVDHFKSYNDSFGHPAGDEVLRVVAQVLLSCVREHDTVARYGGEEFALLLPSTDVEASRNLGERLRRTVEQYPWEFRPITISLGISTISPRAPRAAALIEQADRSLYQSKADGRNRVTHANDIPPHAVDRRSHLVMFDGVGSPPCGGEFLPFGA